MEIHKVLASLQGVQKHSGYYLAHCPAHDDAKSSLSISQKNGKILLKCHAGCSVEMILGALGLSWDTLFMGNGDGAKPKIDKAYDYLDESGRLLYQTVRFFPKDFRQRRPDGQGDWKWNLKGVNLVPYNLPEVIKSSSVFIVEGEKDADRLNAFGLCATTSPLGAGKWRDTYNPYFSDKHVSILSDNDDPGRQHAEDIAKGLLGVAQSVKVIDLPGLKPKGDVSDWLDNGGSKEGLLQLVSSWALFDAAPGKQPLSIEDIILNDGNFVAIDIPAKRTFLSPWLSEQSITLITGWRGVGKSWFVLFALDAVSRQKNFGPWEVEESVPCLYLDGEMAAQDVIGRMEGIGTGERKNPLYIYSDAYAAHMGVKRASLLDEKWRAGMKDFLIKRGVKLWAVDNVASLTPGIDENSKQEWDPINRWLLDLRFAGISTVLLHHTGKGGQQRGTSGREDNIDISIMLDKPSDYQVEDGARFVAHFAKHRIRTRDLLLIADTEFKVMDCGEEGISYIWGDVKKQKKTQILRLSDEEMGVSEIAKTLDVAKSYVSKVRQRAIDEGILSKTGKLTQLGFNRLNAQSGEQNW